MTYLLNDWQRIKPLRAVYAAECKRGGFAGAISNAFM
jgi:hypothetical protein